MNKLSKKALFYIDNGLAVVPLIPGDKKPSMKNWQSNPLTNKESVENYWKNNPNANIGIVLTHPGKGKEEYQLIVIDIDVHNDNGFETLKTYIKNNDLTFNDTYTVNTPSGGKHYYYFVPKNTVTGRNIKALPGIDILAGKSYVVAPPSAITVAKKDENGDKEVKYYTANNQKIAIANEDVLLFIENNKTQQTKEVNVSIDSDGKVRQGNRDNFLYGYALYMFRSGADYNTVYNSCKAINDSVIVSKPSEHMGDKFVKAKVDSAYKYHLEHPYNEPDFEYESFELLDPDYKPSITLKKLSDIEEKEQEWLIPGYLPKGCVGLLSGDGGTGKGHVWANIASSLTNGKPCFFEDSEEFEDHPRKPLKVIYLSSEDDTETVIKKRLRHEGTNMDMVKTLEEEDILKVKIFNDELKYLIQYERPALLILDPWQAYLTRGVNMSSRADVRAVLTPLSVMAHKYGTTVILVTHTNKTSSSGRGKISDSSDLWDYARFVMMVGYTMEYTEEGKATRYLSVEKLNAGEESQTAIFTITNSGINFIAHDSRKNLNFELSRAMTEKGKIKPQNRNGQAQESKLDQAKKAITDILNSSEGWVLKTEIIKLLELAYGITASGTIGNAIKALMTDGIIQSDGKKPVSYILTDDITDNFDYIED